MDEIERAERLSKILADFINQSVCIHYDVWTHHKIAYSKTNGIPKTEIRLSHFAGGSCTQQKFADLDEVENFINNYMNHRKENEILFRRFK